MGFNAWEWIMAHRSHRFIADFDHDNLECVWCMCRPYNKEAKQPCPNRP